MRSRGGTSIRAALAALVFYAAWALPNAPQAGAAPPPNPWSIALSGTNAVGRIHSPGVSCAAGGQGQYRHQFIETPLPAVGVAPGALGNLESVLRGNIVVHRDGPEPVGTPPAAGSKAFLLGTESHATITNRRGAIQLRLQSGDCANPTLDYDGNTASGAGTWSLDPVGTSGAFRQATGNGTFNLSIGTAPGADSPWSLATTGLINVLQPSLKVEVLGTYWGNLGVDYATRKVTVIYKITNPGPGDAFGVTINDYFSNTPGVTPAVRPEPTPLGDLASGESTTLHLRYRFELLQPCQAVILNCNFQTTLKVNLPDALDVVTVRSAATAATAPLLPPPL